MHLTHIQLFKLFGHQVILDNLAVATKKIYMKWYILLEIVPVTKYIAERSDVLFDSLLSKQH